MWEQLDHLFGKRDDLEIGEMAVRAAVGYVVVLVLVRLAGKRLLGRGTPFDLLVIVMIGGMMARSVTGGCAVPQAIVAVAGLLFLDWAISWLSARSSGFELLMEGKPDVLVDEGRVIDAARLKNHVTRDMLQRAAREAKLRGLEDVERVVLEQHGRLSVLPRDKA